MSDLLPADISEYLEKILLLKAAQELEPLRQLALKYEDILKHYPHAAQQVQNLLIPVARKNYSGFPKRLHIALQDLESFHQLLLSVRQDSSCWGTEAECDAIQEKVTLLYLPYEQLNTLLHKHIDLEKYQRLEAEERRLHEIAAQNRKKELLRIVIFTSVIFGISTCVFIVNTKHKPTDFEPVVEAPTTESTVIVKEKKPEKIDKRVSLESYLKGIKNGCEFNRDVAILTPVLEAVRVSTGSNENDYDYTLPPDDKMMEKYPDLYKAIPVIVVQPEYFEVSADINGKFYGLTASKLIRGYGNENGISFFTLVFDSPNAESILKKKINFKTQWYEIGRRELGADFYVEDGKTYMTCDWSN